MITLPRGPPGGRSPARVLSTHGLAVPAQAASPTRILNTGLSSSANGIQIPNWVETRSMAHEGSGRAVVVTFLVEHAQSRRIY